MRSPSRLLLPTAALLAACTDALPTETNPAASTSSASAAEITLSRAAVGAAVGDTVRVAARVRTRAGRDLDAASVRWQSSDPQVAIVEDGLIIPLGPGRARILAQAPSGVSASVVVNTWGGVRVTGLSVDPDPLSVDVGKTVQPSALLLYSNGNRIRLRSSLVWRVVNGALASMSAKGLKGVTAGETKLTASLLTITDTAALQVRGVAPVPPPPSGGVAALPREYLNMPMPAVTGRSIRVDAGDDLQAAINAAQPGDELVLAAGVTFTGPYTLPSKTGDAWIVIRTAGMLPAEGTRVTPAHAAQMPKLVSRYVGEPVIATAAGAHHYRLVGLEITAPAGNTFAGTLVALGSGNGTKQFTMEQQAHHLVLDRVYVHGTPTLNFQRCIGLNSAYTAIVDSWISECHGKGMDSQAIGGWNGTGPYKIVNNHLAGAGENVMFGGADPAIPGALPRDIEFRGNHVYKPKAWQGVWSVKNAFELKIGQRVLVEGNVFENVWPDAQTGFAFVIKSTNQGGDAPWSETSDVTVRYNVIRNSAHGVVLAANPESHPAVPASRMTFAHNVFERIGTGDYPGGRLFQIAGIADLTIEHNTAATNGFGMILNGNGIDRFVARNNIIAGVSFGVSGDGAGSGTSALDTRAPSWTFTGNVITGVVASQYPPGNYFPKTVADVGFEDYAGHDLRLTPTSSFAGLLTGVSPGANFDIIADRTQGVVIQ